MSTAKIPPALLRRYAALLAAYEAGDGAELLRLRPKADEGRALALLDRARRARERAERRGAR